ncbi:glycosyltransferase [Iningainema tapete]|uniref:Glycosyltransferase n=1 Tax=Iningainema tapete BLCC-T55 TaxID=2748662 RepID=A0A8J6XTD0_9CYAN|nr:glycosyltransferase [Iningainema tapete]MBD2777910.1 glycosyltransferase [Iningainema tapete BLCC-T55]
MKIAYLVNQYPKTSHSFIRREIAAIEECGLTVARFSMRRSLTELVEPEDIEESEKTQVILDVGIIGLLFNLLSVVIAKPISWLYGLWLALKIGWNSQRGVLYHIIYLAEACVLLKQLRNLEVTHLHAHFGTNSTTVAMLCQAIGGPPYSFTVHGPYEFDQVESIALTEKINRAAFVVTVSSYSVSQLYRWCNYQQWQKIHLVRCGVDNKFFHQNTTVIPSEPNLVCVGRLCEEKGQLLLIKAVNQLALEGCPCNLTLVGDGPLRSQIETLTQDYSLQDQVKITGWASGELVQKYMINSRALIQPSFAEGLPVVIMEAFALQRPVISTYVAGIPELVKPGVNGWLVPSGSVEALTEAIREVLQLPPEKLEQMGQAGAISVKTYHNVAQEASKLANLFCSASGTNQQ